MGVSKTVVITTAFTMDQNVPRRGRNGHHNRATGEELNVKTIEGLDGFSVGVESSAAGEYYAVHREAYVEGRQ